MGEGREGELQARWDETNRRDAVVWCVRGVCVVGLSSDQAGGEDKSALVHGCIVRCWTHFQRRQLIE